MVVLITPESRHLYRRELDDIFRLRHKVLVETLAWNGVRSQDGHEYDEFDTSDAIYLCQWDSAGAIVGCMRLNSASGARAL